MTSAAKRWVRRTGRGSSKDNEVDDDIWDRNDFAFFEEVSRSRTASLASAFDTHDSSRASYSPSPLAVHRDVYTDLDSPGIRTPSGETVTYTGLPQGQVRNQTSSPPTFRMPFRSPAALRRADAQPLGSPGVQDLRRPSMTSTRAGSYSPPNGEVSTPSRSGVLAGLKRIMRRRGSKKSDTTGSPSLQNSPVLDPHQSRRSYAAHQAEHPDSRFFGLPPSALDPTIANQRVRSPDDFALSTGLGVAIEDPNAQPSQRSYRASRDRQGSAPTLQVPLRTTATSPPLSPRSRFAVWQERVPLSGPALRDRSSVDISPARNISEWTSTPPAWTIPSPPVPRRRSLAYLQSMMATQSAPLQADDATFPEQQQLKHHQPHSPDDLRFEESRPVRPQRSVDLYFASSNTDQEVMDAFNAAHDQKWSGLPSREDSHDGHALHHSRRKSEASPHSMLFANLGTPGPGVSPVPVDGHRIARSRPSTAQDAGESISQSRRRSFTPYDTRRPSVVFPSTSTHSAAIHGLVHHGKSSPVTPSSISRPLSVCSSTFDTMSMNTANSNSYAPTFATSFAEHSLPSPRTMDSGHGSRRYPSSSLCSVSDAQEELEPLGVQGSKSYHGSQHYHQPQPSTYVLKRPSSSGTNTVDLSHPSHAHGYGCAADTGSARRPYQSQAPLHQTPTARPKSATMTSRRLGSAGSTLQGMSTGHFQGTGSYSTCSHPRRRPSFGLDVAPTAAAAFDSIPSPNMISVHLPRLSQSQSQGKHAPNMNPSSAGQSEPLSVKHCLDNVLSSETNAFSMSGSPNADASEDASMADIPLAEPFEMRSPVSDTPMTPDLNGDLEEFDFRLSALVETSSPDTLTARSGDVQVSKDYRGHEDEGQLELLADDLEGDKMQRTRGGVSAEVDQDDSAADAEMAVKAPRALLIHALSKDHQRTRERQWSMDGGGRGTCGTPLAHRTSPSPRQSLSRRRSAHITHGYAAMKPSSTNSPSALARTTDDFFTSLPTPTYSYI
ncbi:unnamed protein product [Tilletia controversa]|uniref:Uncharacterized protein n=3 Tax=Tilletia TaxID=13289 RepID=A0A8X7MSH2_9BASI|nr:hypothetical protein CF336_g2868 [Tilletia laevis]KAE8203184.1 hypothetical protein CF328_g1788 [Tilletia controversa]KAE8262654.1 hypothetical protein A4X03_0g2282 [Tilletia caries]KAE8201048.1 hypothetical protein CF335_g3824 [Tilletia laevis]KAE8246412.1 hypothetical protein A4X06_0g5028 [Tilletia controversa]